MQEQAKALAMELVKDSLLNAQEARLVHLERTAKELRESKKFTCSPAGFRRKYA